MGISGQLAKEYRQQRYQIKKTRKIEAKKRKEKKATRSPNIRDTRNTPSKSRGEWDLWNGQV